MTAELIDSGQAPIPRRPAGISAVPLSAFQQRIHHLCTAYEGTSSPCVFLNKRLHGPLATDAMVRAIGMVVDRHESLRAVIGDTESGPCQTFLPPGMHEVEHIDLSDLPPDEREQRLRDLLGARTKTLFDLRGGTDPLIRSALIRLSETEHVLSIVMHHIIADGASSGILASDLAACYRAAVQGGSPELPELSIGYGDFAHWQRDGLAERVASGLAFWRERLAGVTPLQLPTDFERPAQKATRAAIVGHAIGADVVAEVERLARTSRCSTFMVLLAGYQTMLEKHSGIADICVGTQVAARTRVELEPVIGLFGNTLPMRCDLSGDPTFAELLKRVRSMVLSALTRQEVPFGSVVSHLDLPHDPSRTQVFQTIMALHTETGTDGMDLLGVKTEPAPAGMPQILHDIVLDMWLRPKGLDTAWRYDTALFREETVAAWASSYERILRAAVADPQARLSAL
ncbi:condensation domain-containing protein [Allorhizocola rhizosphaerae]|uniref:condensation domain-containing protein n=1 Tax=Allorhizocola rhizosphaerae TaxID=1872709 RepID=UPI000E3B7F0A|nr:condensation domain-containing protein [Allorhizocola rhizosphaerae]